MLQSGKDATAAWGGAARSNSVRYLKARPQHPRNRLLQTEAYCDRCITLPRHEVDLAAVDEWRHRLASPFGWTNEEMDVNAHSPVIVDHLAMLRGLGGPVLALPIELPVREELVGVPVVGVHVDLVEGHEEKDVRWPDNKADVPDGLAER